MKKVALLVCLFGLWACGSEDGESSEIKKALDYLQRKEVSYTRWYDEAWFATKRYLDLPVSQFRKTVYLQINNDRTLTFFSITDDCEFEGDQGVRAVQSTAGVFDEIHFSDIAYLRTFEQEIGEGEEDGYYIRVMFNQDIQVFTDWYTCSEESFDGLQSSQAVLQDLLIIFLLEKERDEYLNHLKVLRDAGY